MDNKLYVCRSCQYVFPKELSELIESKVQVYCEMCGTPFSLSGVNFKQASVRESRALIHKPTIYGIVDKEKSNLDKAIKNLNKFDFLPIIIFSILTLLLSFFNFPISGGIIPIISSYLIVFSSLLIIIYDSRFISPRIKSNNYDEIPLDAICYGILGCIIYGTGVFLLIKGILIFIYSAKNSEKGDHKIYRFGLKLKNSINNFSAKAGFVILLLVLNGIYFSGIEISAFTIITSFFNDFTLMLIIMSFIFLALIILIIDLKLQKKIYNKREFAGIDVVRTFILGVIGTVFLSIGVFILLKSILLLLLFIGKPIDLHGKLMIKEPEEKVVPRQVDLPVEPKIEHDKKEEISTTQPDSILPEPTIQVIDTEKTLSEEETEKEITIEEDHEEEEITEEISPQEKEVDKEEDITEDIVPQEKKVDKEEEDIKLRLHESLLPVKNEKDRKVVKEYFTKIFNIISKDIRKQISELDIPKIERKNLLRELAFLAEEEQQKYVEELRNLYKEIPKKLIERIRKLPNVKSKYYDKIIEDLKYLDKEQQIEFVKFLEKHA